MNYFFIDININLNFLFFTLYIINYKKKKGINELHKRT